MNRLSDTLYSEVFNPVCRCPVAQANPTRLYKQGFFVGDEMNDNIVFYCKDCKQMFYAGSQEHLDEDSAEEIKNYLLAGHKMLTVDTATVRKDFNGCTCED